MADQLGARKDSGFKAVSREPSVNLTPAGPAMVPIPYPVTADLSEAVGVVPNVRFNGCPAFVLDQSSIPSCKGDGPGTGKGVKSGTLNGEVKPLKGSSTVRVGGKPVIRQGDPCSMQGGNCTGTIVAMTPTSGAIRNGQPTQSTCPPLEPATPEEAEWFSQEPPDVPELSQGRLPAELVPSDPGDSPAGLWSWAKGKARQAWRAIVDTDAVVREFAERNGNQAAGLGRITNAERPQKLAEMARQDPIKATLLQSFLETGDKADFTGGGVKALKIAGKLPRLLNRSRLAIKAAQESRMGGPKILRISQEAARTNGLDAVDPIAARVAREPMDGLTVQSRGKVVTKTTARSGGQAEAARRADLNAKFGRTGELHTDINVRGNKEVARDFFSRAKTPEGKITGLMDGIDFRNQVRVEQLNRNKVLWQYQLPGAPQGNWYSYNSSATPASLGISPTARNRITMDIEQKVLFKYKTSNKVNVLRSIASPANDSWSIPGEIIKTNGGGRQIFSPEKNCFQLFGK